MRRDHRKSRYGDGHPTNLSDFMSIGGMESIEYVAGAKGADEAKRFARECWLERLERWLADGNDGRYEFDDFHKGYLLNQIKRLKRVLGMYKTSEERRSATKERVQSAHWRAEREEKESVSLPRSTGLLGSVGAAYKYLLQAGKEPKVEAITEFLKWKGAQVEIILALSELQSAGHLDRIRKEVLSA
jgi:hypothetical protein